MQVQFGYWSSDEKPQDLEDNPILELSEYPCKQSGQTKPKTPVVIVGQMTSITDFLAFLTKAHFPPIRTCARLIKAPLNSTW